MITLISISDMSQYVDRPRCSYAARKSISKKTDGIHYITEAEHTNGISDFLVCF